MGHNSYMKLAGKDRGNPTSSCWSLCEYKKHDKKQEKMQITTILFKQACSTPHYTLANVFYSEEGGLCTTLCVKAILYKQKTLENVTTEMQNTTPLHFKIHHQRKVSKKEKTKMLKSFVDWSRTTHRSWWLWPIRCLRAKNTESLIIVSQCEHLRFVVK